MATPREQRARQIKGRKERIVAAARTLAEGQGWEAVTTRRLADAIGYSQPVLYGHFPQGRTEIVTAVALVGFEELASELELSVLAAGESGDVETGAARVRALVTAYLDFAARHPATYDAMFLLPILVSFGSDETPAVMRKGFEVIEGALGRLDLPVGDASGAAEVLWGAVHGVAALQRAGRFPVLHQKERIETLVRLVVR